MYFLPSRLGPARSRYARSSTRFGINFGCVLGLGFEVVFAVIFELRFDVDWATF
jgi:hypothetical protein